VLVSAIPACNSHCASIRRTCLHKPLCQYQPYLPVKAIAPVSAIPANMNHCASIRHTCLYTSLCQYQPYLPVKAIVPVSAIPACKSHCASIRPTYLYKPSIYLYNNQVYAPSIDEMVSSFLENRHYFCQYVNTRPHTINNIVNTTDIDNIIDCVRSANGLGQPR